MKQSLWMGVVDLCSFFIKVMANNKKSVLLYCDIIHTVKKLDDVMAGKLFKHYLSYINDEDPKPENNIIDLVFEPIKQNLKRDLKKWNGYIEKQRLNGKKGGRPKTQITQAFISKPKKGVIVKDIVTVKVRDIVKDTINNRLADFRKSLRTYLSDYDKELLNEFYLYWTEKKPKGRKMLFEMQKTFDISRRLKRWDNNNFTKKEKSSVKKEKTAYEVIQDIKYGR